MASLVFDLLKAFIKGKHWCVYIYIFKLFIFIFIKSIILQLASGPSHIIWAAVIFFFSCIVFFFFKL